MNNFQLPRLFYKEEMSVKKERKKSGIEGGGGGGGGIGTECGFEKVGV